MFAFQRSPLSVLVPLALLAAVAWWSNHGGAPHMTGADQLAGTAAIECEDAPAAG